VVDLVMFRAKNFGAEVGVATAILKPYADGPLG
jgi:hypothetical protein